ncbi:MAG: hypothetical protein NW224_15965, partial [Leptolyngbyaceae cyanobacterium bins.302]|nr:hypothetical protein [Leptolyngbyaceae cyanobacterium bins.302]
MSSKKENRGCGCGNIPISFILVLLGLGYWGFTKLDKSTIGKLLPEAIANVIPGFQPPNAATPPAPTSQQPAPQKPTSPQPKPLAQTTTKAPVSQAASAKPAKSQPQSASITPSSPPSLRQTPWQKKAIRGIYLSRYQVTNNAS